MSVDDLSELRRRPAERVSVRTLRYCAPWLDHLDDDTLIWTLWAPWP